MYSYCECISSIDKITGHRLIFTVDKNLFSSGLRNFIDKLTLPENVNLRDGKFNNGEIYHDLESKSMINALTDLILLNKAEIFQDYSSRNDNKTIYMLFYVEQYNSIEKQIEKFYIIESIAFQKRWILMLWKYLRKDNPS